MISISIKYLCVSLITPCGLRFSDTLWPASLANWYKVNWEVCLKKDTLHNPIERPYNWRYYILIMNIYTGYKDIYWCATESSIPTGYCSCAAEGESSHQYHPAMNPANYNNQLSTRHIYLYYSDINVRGETNYFWVGLRPIPWYGIHTRYC